MTIRNYLNQHMRRSTISCWLMIPPAVVALFATAHPVLRYVALVVAGICAASNIYQNFAARCPRCRTRLLGAWEGSAFFIVKRGGKWLVNERSGVEATNERTIISD